MPWYDGDALSVLLFAMGNRTLGICLLHGFGSSCPPVLITLEGTSS